MTALGPLHFDPMVAIGPFGFGATWKTIEKMAGEPDFFDVDDVMKERRETRDKLVLYYRGPLGATRQVNRLRCITLHRGADVLFNGIDLMNDRAVVNKLSDLDKPLYPENPYMVFRELGLILGGFGRIKIKEKKLIMAYAKDARRDYEEFAAKPF